MLMANKVKDIILTEVEAHFTDYDFVAERDDLRCSLFAEFRKWCNRLQWPNGPCGGKVSEWSRRDAADVLRQKEHCMLAKMIGSTHGYQKLVNSSTRTCPCQKNKLTKSTGFMASHLS